MEQDRIIKIRLFLMLEKNHKEFQKMFSYYYSIIPDKNITDCFRESFIKFIKDEFNNENFVDLFTEYISIYNVDLFTFILFDNLTKLVEYIPTSSEMEFLSLKKDVVNFVKSNNNISFDNALYKAVIKRINIHDKEHMAIESKINDKVYLSNYRLYMKEIDKFDLLTKSEERDLIADYLKNRNEESLSALINHNQRLVVSIAFKVAYNASQRKMSVDVLDLIQEGNFGLIDAIEQFDLNKNTKLSTYSYYKIKQKMNRYIENNGRTVRVPVHKNSEASTLYKLETEYRQELGRELTDADKEELIYSKVPYDKKEFLYYPLSLDEKVQKNDAKNESDGQYLIDKIADTRIEPTDAETNRLVDREVIDLAIKKYIETSKRKDAVRNTTIFRLRYGLFNKDCLEIINKYDLKLYRGKDNVDIITTEEIAKAFTIKRARIQQIEATVLEEISKTLISYETELTGVKYTYDVEKKCAVRLR